METDNKKWNLDRIYKIGGITASSFAVLSTVTGLVFLLGRELGFIGQKIEQTNVQVKENSARITKVENEVTKSNIKLDTLLGHDKENNTDVKLYYRETTYEPDVNGKQLKVKRVEASNRKIEQTASAIINETVVDKEVEEIDEKSIAVSSVYEKKLEMKEKSKSKKNLRFISAVFYGDQAIEDNSSVYLRFTDDVNIGSNLFDKNTSFTAIAKKVAGRYYIDVGEIDGKDVFLKAFDEGKNEGINVLSNYKDGFKVSFAY